MLVIDCLFVITGCLETLHTLQNKSVIVVTVDYSAFNKYDHKIGPVIISLHI